ncbi:MAG TPA: segregation/condensation protein A [Spirochaetota bacterium]|nr:segregation/condensation protein A [Spirochaetota bacterium]
MSSDQYVMSTITPGRKVYKVDLPVWNGPLDLLLDLIQASEINIYDIPIAEITSQYLQTIKFMRKLDINVASDFLTMASYLIYIKTRMLLPAELDDSEEEEFMDPRDNLVQQLLEYQKYKKLAGVLEDKEFHSDKLIERRDNQITFKMPRDEDDVWQDVTLFELIKVFSGVVDVIEYDQFGVLKPENINLEDKILAIKETLNKSGKSNFYDFFKDKPSKFHIIITFWAILELFKIGFILIKQHQIFGDIYIFKRESFSAAVSDQGKD